MGQGLTNAMLTIVVYEEAAPGPDRARERQFSRDGRRPMVLHDPPGLEPPRRSALRRGAEARRATYPGGTCPTGGSWPPSAAQAFLSSPFGSVVAADRHVAAFRALLERLAPTGSGRGLRGNREPVARFARTAPSMLTAWPGNT